MEDYAKTFFDDESYKKIEIGFLHHNINIWYSIGITENKFDPLDYQKLINKPFSELKK
jgi:hypothetical protein